MAFSSSVKTFKNFILTVHDNNDIKLLTRFRQNFSYLNNKHNFRHNFLDAINPMRSCDSEPKTTAHFLLRCQNHIINRSQLLKNVSNLNQILQNYDEDHTLLYGWEKSNFNLNKKIIRLADYYRKISNALIRASFEFSNVFCLLLSMYRTVNF